jgi:hypothetical protein
VRNDLTLVSSFSDESDFEHWALYARIFGVIQRAAMTRTNKSKQAGVEIIILQVLVYPERVDSIKEPLFFALNMPGFPKTMLVVTMICEKVILYRDSSLTRCAIAKS